MNRIDVDKIKEQITSEYIKKIMATFNCYPKSENNENIIFPSICHHPQDFELHKAKLYWYKDAKYFLCYSCSSSFDIFGLVQQVKSFNFPQAIKYVCECIGIDSSNLNVTNDKKDIYDWKSSLNKYLVNNSTKENQEYDKSILNFLDKIYYQGWINEGINIETMEKFGVKFYKFKQQIVIPIFDDENRFVGTHCRNLLPELIEQNLKYYHLQTLNRFEYKFSMSSVLFGLNLNRYNIEQTRTCVIFESPKSVMIYDGFNCLNNSVGIFGMNFQKAKRDLLIKYKCENFIIALDRQYVKMYNEDGSKTNKNTTENKENGFKEYETTIMKIVKILSPFAKNIWVVYDNDENNYLDYKDSPVDKGEEIWLKMEQEKELVYSIE